jgi:AcrR family transcriptional regulator
MAPVRPLRADARRNRDQLLRVAADMFADQGVEKSSLEEIARRAGVGIGTLYRHFPTREALIADVYRAEIERLCARVDVLIATEPIVDGLKQWMHEFVDYASTKRGMATALSSMMSEHSELFDYSRGLMNAAAARLVAAAVAAGQIRPDATADDVLRGLRGFCTGADYDGWQEQAHRLVDLLIDGLRYSASAAS